VFTEEITIGSTIESAAYSLVNNTYFLPTLQFGPLFYETVDFKFLQRPEKDYYWSRILLKLSLQGKLLTSNHPKNIKIEGDKIRFNSGDQIKKYCFKKCYIFDSTGVKLENKILKPMKTLFRVYDDFELSNLGGKHKTIKPKVSNHDLAKEIHFYISDRVDGANYVTDCVAESLLTKEQLNDFEFSDSMVRFAVMRHLTSLGIHGNFMNLYKSGKPKFRKPKVVHRKRLVLEKERNVYADSEHVKFLNLKTKEIFDDKSTPGA
tara:strand:- start:299 stop:1087 length:789 start_codon:yes stop_codon:yes gene_type:complete